MEGATVDEPALRGVYIHTLLPLLCKLRHYLSSHKFLLYPERRRCNVRRSPARASVRWGPLPESDCQIVRPFTQDQWQMQLTPLVQQIDCQRCMGNPDLWAASRSHAVWLAMSHADIFSLKHESSIFRSVIQPCMLFLHDRKGQTVYCLASGELAWHFQHYIQGWMNDLNMLLSCFREKMPGLSCGKMRHLIWSNLWVKRPLLFQIFTVAEKQSAI